MADRDVFRRKLPWGLAAAGRAFADRRIEPAAAAVMAFEGIPRMLARHCGIPRPLFRSLCAVVAAAERDYREHPLLPEGVPEAYARRVEIRNLCRAHRAQGVLLAEYAEDAAQGLLVDARQFGGAATPVRQRLARGILLEIFNSFAETVKGLLQEQEGFSAEEARERVEQCRDAFLALPRLEELARKVARRPEARHRIKAAQMPKKSQKELIVQPLGEFISAASEQAS